MAGHMDLERGKRMREDAIFRIYSMSKPITAVALMMLVEEGLIGLDDDVPRTFRRGRTWGFTPPACRRSLADAPAELHDDAGRRPMKVVDLVTHTSGLTYGFMNPHQRRCRVPSGARWPTAAPRAGSTG